jgi:hypothetical protein
MEEYQFNVGNGTIWALPASIVVFVLALFIKQVPLRGRAPSENAPAPEAEALIG